MAKVTMRVQKVVHKKIQDLLYHVNFVLHYNIFGHQETNKRNQNDVAIH